jgi:hypothetical protein
VRRLLSGTDLARPESEGAGTRRWLSSGDVAWFRELGRRLLGPELDEVAPISWS